LQQPGGGGRMGGGIVGGGGGVGEVDGKCSEADDQELAGVFASAAAAAACTEARFLAVSLARTGEQGPARRRRSGRVCKPSSAAANQHRPEHIVPLDN